MEQVGEIDAALPLMDQVGRKLRCGSAARLSATISITATQ
jgi:hypothetical protein